MTNMDESLNQMQSLTIRDCTLKDASTIAAIYNDYVRSGGSTMDTEEKSSSDIERQIQQFSDRETILVLEKEGEFVGWGIIKQYSDRVGYRYCCETSVYLRRESLGQGYGTLLKKAVIERCRQYKYHHLVAKIFASNLASIEYNKKLGYEVVGRQREIDFRDGRWQDIVIMQLLLDDVQPPTA